MNSQQTLVTEITNKSIPKISVIMLTYNQNTQLHYILAGFAKQTLPKHFFEILIIDDGSLKSPESIVKEFEKDITINLTLLPHTGNRAHNRNIGIELSKAERILFLDGDMIPCPEFLDAHEKATRENQNIVSMAMRNLIDPFNDQQLTINDIQNKFHKLSSIPGCIDDRTFDLAVLKKNGVPSTHAWNLLFSHNVCIWKKVFIDAGGFDNTFAKNWGGEDTELGYRLFKNNIQLVFLNTIQLYHIHHETNFIDKIPKLEKNLQYLYKKHNDWETEIYTLLIDILTWNYQSLRAAILQQKGIISALSNADTLIDSLPYNSITIGITDTTLLHCDKITVALTASAKINAKKCIPIIGIQTRFHDKEFDAAVVSTQYANIDLKLFEKIIAETNRISKKILLVDENGLINNSSPFPFIQQMSIGNFLYTPQPKVCMCVSRINSYVFFNLAYYLHKQNIDVAIESIGDPSIKNDFFKTSAILITRPEKQRIIHSQLSNSLNYFNSEIPTITDQVTEGFEIRAINHKHFWGEIHTSKKQSLTRGYDYFLLKNFQEHKRIYKNSRFTSLPIGIDSDLVNSFTPHANSDSIVFGYFVWGSFAHLSASLILDTFDQNICSIISTFLKTAKSNPNLSLRIYLPDFTNASNTHKTSLILNKPCINSIVEKYRVFKNIYIKEFKTAQRMTKGHPNITLHMETLSEESMLSAMNKCDCIIDCNPSIYFPPTLLNAAALGKKILSCNRTSTYKEYLHSDFLLPYAHSQSVTEKILHFLRIKKKLPSLETHFKTIAENPNCLRVPKERVQALHLKYSWESIAQKFAHYISEYTHLKRNL